MVDEPYVNHVPTLTGGVGHAKLSHFYRHHFIFSNPEDTELELVSRTVGIDRVVDEFLFKLTHNRMIDWLYVPQPTAVRTLLSRFLTGRYIGSLVSRLPASTSRYPSRASSTSAETSCSTSISRGTKQLFYGSLACCLTTSLSPTPCQMDWMWHQGKRWNTDSLWRASSQLASWLTRAPSSPTTCLTDMVSVRLTDSRWTSLFSKGRAVESTDA